MRLTEATSGDTAVLSGETGATKRRQSAAVPPTRDSDNATSQFASVLSATRRSSNRLLDVLKTQSQAKRDAVEQQEQRVEGRADERVDQSSKKGSRRERTERPRRSEQLRSMAHDRAETTERVEPRPERTEEKVDQAVEKDTTEQKTERPATVPWAGAPVIVPTAPVQTSVPQTASIEAAGELQGQAGVSGAAAVPLTPTSGETLAASAPTVQASADTGSVQAIKPASPTGMGTGAIAASTTGGQPADAPAPATTTSRTGGTEGDFKSLLQHLSRTRVGEPPVSAASLVKSKTPVGRADKPLDMESADSVDDLARVVRSRIGPRKSSMTMTMSPADLGRLRIDVRMEDSAVTVQFQTETAAGHDAIKAKLHELKGALEQQGIQVDRIEVQYLPPTPSASHQGQGHGQPTPDGGQWQNPAGYDGSAGQARQSFDQPRHETTGSSWSGQEAVAGEPATETVSWNWLHPGVDLVA